MVSAKTGEAVNEMFSDLCQKLIKISKMRSPPGKGTKKLVKKKEEKKG